MIELSSTETTTIGFKINIEGNSETPSARFLLKISDDISLMFPSRVHEDKAVVNVPALSFLSSLKESELPACLEVMVNGSYFTPWQGMALLKTPVKVQANLDTSQSVNMAKQQMKNIVSAEVDTTVQFEEKEYKSKVKKPELNEEKEEQKKKTESFSDFIRKKGLG